MAAQKLTRRHPPFSRRLQFQNLDNAFLSGLHQQPVRIFGINNHGARRAGMRPAASNSSFVNNEPNSFLLGPVAVGVRRGPRSHRPDVIYYGEGRPRPVDQAVLLGQFRRLADLPLVLFDPPRVAGGDLIDHL